MAPKYAPSLRARLPPVALLLQITFILIFAFCVEIERKEKDGEFMISYASKWIMHSICVQFVRFTTRTRVRCMVLKKKAYICMCGISNSEYIVYFLFFFSLSLANQNSL